LGVCLALVGAAAAHAVELQWWSHWAIEDAKKTVLFEAKRRFEAKNPGHTVTITFYEKKNMWPTLRAAFTAGSGFPNVFYYDLDALLNDKLGADEFMRLLRGEISWKDPRVVEVFHYYKELIDLGAYAKTLNSMTLAEAHRYFHTEQKACMFPVGSWYTGRAFVPPDKGGQPRDFELGMLNNPLTKDGK